MVYKMVMVVSSCKALTNREARRERVAEGWQSDKSDAEQTPKIAKSEHAQRSVISCKTLTKREARRTSRERRERGAERTKST